MIQQVCPELGLTPNGFLSYLLHCLTNENNGWIGYQSCQISDHHSGKERKLVGEMKLLGHRPGVTDSYLRTDG